MYNIDVVTKTLNIQWKLLPALNTHSGSPLSAQMLWPWVWAERARVARTRTHSSDCCDHPACEPEGSRGTNFYTSETDGPKCKILSCPHHPSPKSKEWWSAGVFVTNIHLKCEEGHDNSHPADRHGDVSPPLLSDDVDGAKKKDRPDDVVEDDKAEEGHEDPQWDTHHLQHTQRDLVLIKTTLFLSHLRKRSKCL